MAVHCSKCGEKLMGAVNRCWRCGQEFATGGIDADVPPVRRPPVPSGQTTVVAELVNQDAESESPPSAENEPVISAPIRRGSPFADRGTATLEQVTPRQEETPVAASPRQPNYPRYGGSVAGAALTFPLGLMSLLVAFLFPIGGLILAAFGIGLGTWGLYSRHRGFALAGLLLCCLCLGVAGFNGVVELYEKMHGVKPWETAGPYIAP